MTDKPYTERTGGSYVRDKSGERKLVQQTLAESPAEKPKATPATSAEKPTSPAADQKKDK